MTSQPEPMLNRLEHVLLRVQRQLDEDAQLKKAASDTMTQRDFAHCILASRLLTWKHHSSTALTYREMAFVLGGISHASIQYLCKRQMYLSPQKFVELHTKLRTIEEKMGIELTPQPRVTDAGYYTRRP